MRRALAILAVMVTTAPALSAPAPHFADAGLHAIEFVDRNEGWAVGDDGVIWHTIDGGDHWERQSSGTRASFRAVQFLTPYSGFIVGRRELPDGGSVGVVLSTTDGGLRWTERAFNAMPGLNDVRFFNEQVGLVVGDGCPAFPTGVFRTVNGGRTWEALPGPRCPGWLGADFSSADSGVLAGSWGRLATLRDGMFGAADVSTLSGRAINAVKLDGNRAVAVGEGGLVLISHRTAGVRWAFAELGLPREMLACCDFADVCVSGSHLWVVGRPGTVVLHSPDFGKRWEILQTGQSLPLRSVRFLNEKEGWAVGECGTILVTRDGGKSWQIQQRGGQRAAVLVVGGSEAQFPTNAIADLGAEEGYLVTTLHVAGPDTNSEAPSQAGRVQRSRESIRQIGGTTSEALWQFPLMPHAIGASPEQLLADWDRLHADQSPVELLRQMVLAIRVWQPEVVITADPKESPLDAIVFEALKEAFKEAEHENAFPEQITLLGLSPWKAKKLYTRTSSTVGAQVVVGGETGEGFRLAATRLKDSEHHQRLMQGIALAPGGTARREVTLGTEEEQPKSVRVALDAARREWATLRTLCSSETLPNPDRVLSQLRSVLSRLPETEAVRCAHELAHDFARSGQWFLARELFLLMVERYPADPLAVSAYRWLAQFHASSEARRRHELGHFLVTGNDPIRTVTARPGEEADNGVTPADVRESDRGSRSWFRGSLAIESRLSGFGPLFAHDPSVLLCLNAARRQLGDVDEASAWYRAYLTRTEVPSGGPTLVAGAAPWRDCVASELWLLDRKSGSSTSGGPPKPFARCPECREGPELDGKLDDACWANVKPLTLRDVSATSAESHATRVQITADDRYLYIAISCQGGAHTQVPTQTLARDSDLSAQDRVSVMLDLDRDYQTYFRFQVDRRGVVADDCWGDASWNPNWQVRVMETDDGWNAELAIPLRELTAERPKSGTVWAWNVTRVIPGVGMQAWSTPAGVVPRPEGMGLLQFVDGE